MAFFNKIDRTKPDFNSAVMITAMLRALIKGYGPEKAAEYYLDALAATKYADNVLSGLYIQAGLPGEYADPIEMIKKEGGLTKEEYEQKNAEHRKKVLLVLTSDFKRCAAQFKAEAKAYNDLHKQIFSLTE